MQITLFKKILNTLRDKGIFFALLKLLEYPILLLQHINFKCNMLILKSCEDKFTWIYKNKHWGNHETISGTGSTLNYTKNLRKELSSLLKKYSIKSLFDAPCGDFNWMEEFLSSENLNYIGGDIVKPLIEKLNKKFQSNQTFFIHFDLTKDIPPKVDLMICRDCLFHLSNIEIKNVLQNFVKSEIPYLLTTTHINTGNVFSNSDITTGNFRLLDLTSNPFNLPTEVQFSIDDWMPPEPARKMCLWSRDQVTLSLISMKI